MMNNVCKRGIFICSTAVFGVRKTSLLNRTKATVM